MWVLTCNSSGLYSLSFSLSYMTSNSSKSLSSSLESSSKRQFNMSSSLRNDFDLRDIILLATKFIYAETRIKLAIDQGDTYYSRRFHWVRKASAKERRRFHWERKHSAKERRRFHWVKKIPLSKKRLRLKKVLPCHKTKIIISKRFHWVINSFGYRKVLPIPKKDVQRR